MRIGFIGLGNIGGPAALHLVEAGHQVTVHDLVRPAAAAHIEKGARWADSPAEAARGCLQQPGRIKEPEQIRALSTMRRHGI